MNCPNSILSPFKTSRMSAIITKQTNCCVKIAFHRRSKIAQQKQNKKQNKNNLTTQDNKSIERP